MKWQIFRRREEPDEEDTQEEELVEEVKGRVLTMKDLMKKTPTQTSRVIQSIQNLKNLPKQEEEETFTKQQPTYDSIQQQPQQFQPSYIQPIQQPIQQQFIQPQQTQHTDWGQKSRDAVAYGFNHGKSNDELGKIFGGGHQKFKEDMI